MSRPAPPKSRLLAFAPWVLGGVVVGLVVVLVVTAWKSPPPPTPFDPLAETDPPMVALPGGTFVMGTDDGPADQQPAHAVTLRPFRMDATEVTNAQFARFVKATGYRTVAERLGSSAVFVPVKASLHGPWDTPHPPWWELRDGASWRHPAGPGTDLNGKMTHPAIHIAWDDANAYAEWAGKRLPTEAEWEYAARGGLERAEYCWGAEPQGQGGVWRANTFQGTFPHADTAADGFAGTAPVRSFPPNGYGLHDLSGNVWEWCADWYRPDAYRTGGADNPTGPASGALDGSQPQRVRRGGSYLCDDGYCRRYLPAARDKNPADSGASHTGFRCVR